MRLCSVICFYFGGIVYSNFFVPIRLYGTAGGHGFDRAQNRSHVQDSDRDIDHDSDRDSVHILFRITFYTIVRKNCIKNWIPI